MNGIDMEPKCFNSLNRLYIEGESVSTRKILLAEHSEGWSKKFI